jgi:hypothetical protein
MVQLGNRNWPYQANVMKMLEMSRRMMVSMGRALTAAPRNSESA